MKTLFAFVGFVVVIYYGLIFLSHNKESVISAVRYFLDLIS